MSDNSGGIERKDIDGMRLHDRANIDHLWNDSVGRTKLFDKILGLKREFGSLGIQMESFLLQIFMIGIENCIDF
jgi:hypothetical protein